jgi:nuclear transport factor 2 (NTF2) superfamily protein
MAERPPFPLFNRESAIQKVRLAEDAWNSRDAAKVALAYEWHGDSGDWFRSCENENWEFEPNGLMRNRFASINGLPIAEADRKFHWPQGWRPDDLPGPSELGL